jgi:flagellar biosynthesis protein FlhG
MGKTVVAVDANLGSPNLHAFLGIRSPGRTLLEVMEERSPLEGALSQTADPRLRLLACTGDSLGMADLPVDLQKEMIRQIYGISADYVLLDLGSSASIQVLDFFNAADRPIVAACPDPTSIHCAFAFLRNAFHRKVEKEFEPDGLVGTSLRKARKGRGLRLPAIPDLCAQLALSNPGLSKRLALFTHGFRPVLILNMATSEEDHRTAAILQSAVKQNLGVELGLAGIVVADDTVRRAAQRMTPLDFDGTRCPVPLQIREATRRLLQSERPTDQGETGAGKVESGASPLPGLNNNLEFLGRRLHVQTEDLGNSKRSVTTQVFLNGRVVHSTKSAYPEPAGGSPQRVLIEELMRVQHLTVMREIQNQKGRLVKP